jgi:hypothetical protein
MSLPSKLATCCLLPSRAGDQGSPDVTPNAVRGLLQFTALAAVGAVGILLLSETWIGPDIFYHMFLGDRIAATGNFQPPDHLTIQQPGFVNFYWLFQVAMSVLFRAGGHFAVSGFFMTAWAAAIVIWLRTCRTPVSSPWVPALALCALLACEMRFEARPEVLSYVFLALQVDWICRWDPRQTPLNIAYARYAGVEILWANVHGYFAFGPLLILLRLFSLPFEGCRPTARAYLRLGALLGLTLLASLATPFGIRGWRNVVIFSRFLTHERSLIEELHPTVDFFGYWQMDIFGCLWLCLGGLVILALLSDRRANLFPCSLAAVGLLLSATAVRNLPFLVFLSGPCLSLVAPLLGPWDKRSVSIRYIVIIGASFLSIMVISGEYYSDRAGVPGFGIRESEAYYPLKVLPFLDTHPRNGVIFDDPSAGSYLEFYRPELRLYGDSRFYDERTSEGYFRALTDPDSFARLEEKERFPSILLRISQSETLINELRSDPVWHISYEDRFWIIFSRVSTKGS